MATKDEKFVLSLYKLAKAKGDLHAPFNRYELGKQMGFNPKSVDGICAMLFQANFIRKSGDEDDIYLSDNGLSLVRSLLGED